MSRPPPSKAPYFHAVQLTVVPVYISFAVNAWAALAPGISTQAQWLEWAANPWLPSGQVTAELADIAPMQRRRLSRLGKLAASVATEASQGSDLRTLPTVWASRYGDAQRSLDMLIQHVEQQTISPTAFGLGVHNGIGAQYSIAKALKQNATSIAAGATTVEAAIVDAVALLSDGHPEVLVVHYDAPLPDAYAVFHDHAMAEFAWALCLSAAPLHAEAPRFALRIRLDSDAADAGLRPSREERPEPPSPETPDLPPGLQVLQFMLGPHERLARRDAGHRWSWSREDG